jgi:hypothetical protein
MDNQVAVCSRWKFSPLKGRQEPFQSEETICRLSSSGSETPSKAWRTTLSEGWSWWNDWQFFIRVIRSIQIIIGTVLECIYCRMKPVAKILSERELHCVIAIDGASWLSFCQNHHTMYSSIQPMWSRSNKVNKVWNSYAWRVQGLRVASGETGTVVRGSRPRLEHPNNQKVQSRSL